MPTRAQLVSYIYGEPLAARPGAVDSYSNSAFTVLTSIVEKASGRRFIDYLRNDVLAPLGIDDVHVGATAATAGARTRSPPMTTRAPARRRLT